MLSKKLLQLNNVESKVSRREGASLLNSNGALDEIREAFHSLETTKSRFIESHDGSEEAFKLPIS
jgi:hypothetical protein